MNVTDNRDKESSPYFSVLMITYNPVWEKLKATLDSVLLQDFKDYEIIFADDGSKENLYPKVKRYLEHRGFSNYIMLPNAVNQGTVKNILVGASFCRGRYVKIFGPGDMFYDRKTLGKLSEYINATGHKLIAGYPIGFTETEDGRKKKVSFPHPFDITAYQKSDEKRILKNLLLYSDTVCGANILYERELLIHYLDRIEGRVIYAEDLTQIMAALDGTRIHFMDDCMVLYEVDTGSSTVKNSPFKQLLKKDVEEFYKLLSEEYPDNRYIKKRLKLSKYYEIDNLYLRTLVRSVSNPGLYIYMLRHYMDILTGKYNPPKNK